MDSWASLIAVRNLFLENNMSPFQEMKADRDKLLKIVELVAVGTSWEDFQRLYKDYKNGDELSVWEERAKEIYERGRQEGFKQGEIVHMNRDSKRYCTTCGVSK
jgi:hypothetical protein